MGRLGDFFDEWGPEALLGTPSIAGIFASLYPNKSITILGQSIRLWVLALIFSVIFAVIGACKVVRKNKMSEQIRAAAAKDREVAEKYHRDIRELIKDNLRDLALDCDLNSGTRTCRTDTRISVYCHDRGNGRFIPIARISGDPVFEKDGRSHYPDDQGFICKAWRNEECTYEFGLDETISHRLQSELNLTEAEVIKKVWLDDQKDFGIPEDVAEQFIMKSKSAVAWRIEHRDTKIGVAVIESTSKDVANGTIQEKIKNSSHFPPLQRALYRINESHIRHVASLADQP